MMKEQPEDDWSIVLLRDMQEGSSDEQSEVTEPAKSVIKTLISLSCSFIAQCAKRDLNQI